MNDSPALGQSCDYPSASKGTIKNLGKGTKSRESTTKRDRVLGYTVVLFG